MYLGEVLCAAWRKRSAYLAWWEEVEGYYLEVEELRWCELLCGGGDVSAAIIWCCTQCSEPTTKRTTQQVADAKPPFFNKDDQAQYLVKGRKD